MKNSQFLVFLIISVISSSVSAEFHKYDISHVFGEEVNFYYRNFDIIFGNLNQTNEFETNNTRETAHYIVTDSEEIDPKTRANSDTKENFWTQIKEEKTIKSLTVAILITIKELKSLDQIVQKVREILSERSQRHETNLKPYFIIRYHDQLTLLEEQNIRKRTELAYDLDIDTDVYFTFLRCSVPRGNMTNDRRETKDAYCSKAVSNCSETKRSFRFLPSTIPVPDKICPQRKAEIRMLEFYTMKNQSFIEPIDFTSGLLMQKVIRRNNLRNAPLNLVAAYGYPYRAKYSPNNDSFEGGYEVDQIKFLGESFNMSLLVGVGTGWISRLENGSLSGMGKQILIGEADISISASEVLTYRAQSLQFLHPTYYTKLWGFFVQPPTSSFRDIFIHAFTLDLWMTMLSTWILIVLAMMALSFVKNKLNTMHENDHILMEEIVIWGIGAVCQQGWHICPESTCMKIIFIFALITGLVSYVAYSAALVSILSVKVVPVKNFDDIINRGYTIYQDNQTINAMFVIQQLEQEGKVPCLPIEKRSIRSEVALPKILSKNEQSAFVGAADFFYPVAKDNMSDTQICNSISSISVSGRPVRGGMFIRKGSPLKDFFNHRLLLMYERGLRYRLLEAYFKQSAVMCLEKTSGATKDPLGFNDVYTAFLVLLVGYCVSLFILVGERMYPPVEYRGDGYGGDTDNLKDSGLLCSKALDKIGSLMGLGSLRGPAISVTDHDAQY